MLRLSLYAQRLEAVRATDATLASKQLGSKSCLRPIRSVANIVQCGLDHAKYLMGKDLRRTQTARSRKPLILLILNGMARAALDDFPATGSSARPHKYARFGESRGQRQPMLRLRAVVAGRRANRSLLGDDTGVTVAAWRENSGAGMPAANAEPVVMLRRRPTRSRRTGTPPHVS